MGDRKTALVTGSTSGIGLGIARRLAADGFDIVLTGSRADAEETRAAIESDFGVQAVYLPADLADVASLEAMARAALEELGAIDVLVNNAGIQHVAPVDEFPPEKWDAIIGIDLSAVFHMTRLLLPGMKERGWGRIVNIASAHALVASPYKAAYVAAKHGVAGLTKVVALEVAQLDITVNAVCPGYVLTPLVEKQIPDTARARGISEEEVVRDVMLYAQPTKRMITIHEVAALTSFLVSDAAASITGAILPIDGGWTAA